MIETKAELKHTKERAIKCVDCDTTPGALIIRRKRITCNLSLCDMEGLGQQILGLLEERLHREGDTLSTKGSL